MGKIYKPPFDYWYEVPDYLPKYRTYLNVYRIVKEEAFHIGRLELNHHTKHWKLGISISAQQIPNAMQVANLEAWANQHIPRKRKKLLEKENDNQSTMAQYQMEST